MGFSGPAASSPIPPGVPGHDAELVSVFDPEAARQNLDTALDELGLSGPDELRSDVPARDAGRRRPAVSRAAVARRPRNRGRVHRPRVRSVLRAVYSGGHEFDMFWLQWFADYPHPQTYLEPLWACESAAQPSGYCIPSSIACWRKRPPRSMKPQQLDLYGQAQRVLVETSAAHLRPMAGRLRARGSARRRPGDHPARRALRVCCSRSRSGSSAD